MLQWPSLHSWAWHMHQWVLCRLLFPPPWFLLPSNPRHLSHSFYMLCPYPSSYMVCAAGKKISSSKLGWFVSLIVLVGMVSLGVIGYIIYKYRLRVQFFDSANSPAYFFPCIVQFWVCVLDLFKVYWALVLLLSLLLGGEWQSYMDSEIRAIMAQYMPLDSQNEVHNHMQEDAWTAGFRPIYTGTKRILLCMWWEFCGRSQSTGTWTQKKHLVLFAISVCPWFQKSSQTTPVFSSGLMV